MQPVLLLFVRNIVLVSYSI